MYIETIENALTAHLQVEKSFSHDEIEKLKDKIKHELEHYKCTSYNALINFNDREFLDKKCCNMSNEQLLINNKNSCSNSEQEFCFYSL